MPPACRRRPGACSIERRDPDITLAIDAVWRIREEFPRLVGMFGGDVHKVIVHCIAYDYYDYTGLERTRRSGECSGSAARGAAA